MSAIPSARYGSTGSRTPLVRIPAPRGLFQRHRARLVSFLLIPFSIFMLCFPLFSHYLIARPRRGPLDHLTAGLFRRLLSISTVIILEYDCFWVSPGIRICHRQSPCNILSVRALSSYDLSALHIWYGFITF